VHIENIQNDSRRAENTRAVTPNGSLVAASAAILEWDYVAYAFEVVRVDRALARHVQTDGDPFDSFSDRKLMRSCCR